MAIQKRNFLIPLIPVILIAVVGVVAARAKFRYVHPRAPELNFVVGDRGGPVLVVEVDKDKVGNAPKAVVEQDLYDFGTMDPLLTATHEFVIRNAGDAPLRLANAGTSCKCADAKLESTFVLPGEQTTVLIEFNTGSKQAYYQTANITTNDPQREFIRLQIRGRIRARVAAKPASIVVGNVDPVAEFVPGRMLIYSQSLGDLRLLEAKGEQAPMEWTTGPATEEELAEVEAKSGWWLNVRVPLESVGHGRFMSILELTTEGVDADSEEGGLVQETVRVGVVGEVARRFCVYGRSIDYEGRIKLPDVVQGESHSVKLLVKIRDPITEIKSAEVTVAPSFIQHSWSKQQQGEGLYVLELRIPENAPVGDYSGNFAGQVKIVPDHPRIEPQQFKLEFDVLSKLD